MRRTLCRLAAQPKSAIEHPPLIRINNGTFYRQHPASLSLPAQTTKDESHASVDNNPPLFPGLDFTLPAFSSPNQHWSVLSKSSAVRTTFLHILRGQHLCFPPTARSFPYLGTDEVAEKDLKLRNPSHAIQYVGFDAERGPSSGSSMRGAYMSARYESRKEETDFSLLDYLAGNTELNAEETLVKHPDQALLEQVMIDLKLETLGSMPVTNLSNGQTRRARIAKALLAKPEVLLLDGPFMGLDPPTVVLLASILQKLAEAHAPRLILSLKPDEDFPHWITHMAYLTSKYTVDSMGPRKEVVKSIHDRAQQFIHSPRTDNPNEDMLELAETSRRLREKEPRPDRKITIEESRLRSRDNGRKRREKKDGPIVVCDIPESPRLTENTIVYAPGEPKYFRSRDGFSAVPQLPPPPGEPLIEMKGVNVKYGDKSVLGEWKQEVGGEEKEGLWWDVCRGQRWGVFGPNGSGKTTLISLITSDHPQTYSLPITIFGRSRLPQLGKPGISIFDIQSRIGHSSPEVHVFFPKYLSLRRTIESAWADTPLTKVKLTYEMDEKVSAVLRWFRGELHPSLGPSELQIAEMTRMSVFDQPWLAVRHAMSPKILQEINAKLEEDEQDPHSVDWADNIKFGELSFSAQRVALFIRAVIRNPDIVILDEAFSGMDDAARDKCHLFLSRGETAVFRTRSQHKQLAVRSSGPVPLESDISRLGRTKVHGLQKHQALIVVSHKKEEVPGCVRDWICLPEAGHGPPRMGQLEMPLELGLNGWLEIWDAKFTPLRTAKNEGVPRFKNPEEHEKNLEYQRAWWRNYVRRETPAQKTRRLARQRVLYRMRLSRETPEQRRRRIDSVQGGGRRRREEQTEEERKAYLEHEAQRSQERRVKLSAEKKETLLEAQRRRYREWKEKTTTEEQREVFRQAQQARKKRMVENEAERERIGERLKEIRRRCYQKMRANETEEERAERNRRRLEKQTPEQRERRLEKLREYARSLTPEQRERRMEKQREYAKRVKETPEQREKRLERQRAYRKRRREGNKTKAEAVNAKEGEKKSKR